MKKMTWKWIHYRKNNVHIVEIYVTKCMWLDRIEKKMSNKTAIEKVKGERGREFNLLLNLQLNNRNKCQFYVLVEINEIWSFEDLINNTQHTSI